MPSSKHRARCALRTWFGFINTAVDTTDALSHLHATDTPRQKNEPGQEAETHSIQLAANISQTPCGQVQPEKGFMPSWRPSNVRLRVDSLHWQTLEGTYGGVLILLTRSVRCQRGDQNGVVFLIEEIRNVFCHCQSSGTPVTVAHISSCIGKPLTCYNILQGRCRGRAVTGKEVLACTRELVGTHCMLRTVVCTVDFLDVFAK